MSDRDRIRDAIRVAALPFAAVVGLLVLFAGVVVVLREDDGSALIWAGTILVMVSAFGERLFEFASERRSQPRASSSSAADAPDAE